MVTPKDGTTSININTSIWITMVSRKSSKRVKSANLDSTTKKKSGNQHLPVKAYERFIGLMVLSISVILE
jgi:hypothetical protein